MPAARTTFEVDAPPAVLMGVILDFAHYPQFVADMLEATVLRHEGDEWTVRFAILVIRRLEYTLQLTRTGEHTVSWSLVEGVFRANTGGWTLTPLDGGARTQAEYHVELDLGMFVPGSVMKTLIERSLPATMECFKRRAEAASAP